MLQMKQEPPKKKAEINSQSHGISPWAAWRAAGGMAGLVQHATGQLRLSTADLSDQTLGAPWGHARSYANVLVHGEARLHGPGWMVAQQPYLVFSKKAAGTQQPERICLVTGACSSEWFVGNLSGSLEPEFGGLSQLVWDRERHEYVATSADGWRRVFFDHTDAASEVMQGLLKQVIDPAGRVINASYDGNGCLVALEQDWEGETRGCYYRYVKVAGLTRMESATMKLGGVFSERVLFRYYEAGMAGGMAGDLQLARVERYDARKMSWTCVRNSHYRYYLPGQRNGFEHGLKHVLDDGAFARMTAAGLDPLTAAETEVAAFADIYLEYDEDHRVSFAATQGGREKAVFRYEMNLANPGMLEVNTWSMKTTQTLLNGGGEARVYCNEAGQELVSILEQETGALQCEAWEYDEGCRLVSHVHPSAVASVQEPSANDSELKVLCRASQGTIEVWEYYVATDLQTGAVEGCLQSYGVKQGSEGLVEPKQTFEYLAHTVEDITIYPVRAEYHHTAAGAAWKTEWAYSWHLDGLGAPTFRVLEETRTVSSQAGAGDTFRKESVGYDASGAVTWKLQERGASGPVGHEKVAARLFRDIQDEDIALMEQISSDEETLRAQARRLEESPGMEWSNGGWPAFPLQGLGKARKVEVHAWQEV